MFEKDSWPRNYFSLFSRKEVKRWLILTVFAFGLFFIMWGGGGWYSSFGSLFNMAVTVGCLLATGFPFVMGSSLILCSNQTRNRIVEKTKANGKVTFSDLFMAYLILNLSVMSLIVFVSLVIAISASGYLSLIGVLPQLLGITLGISLFLTPIYVLIALEFDSMKKSIAMGFFLAIALNFATGFPRFPVNYPEIALFGPSHLLNALLFIAIGAYGNYAVEYHVGLLFQPIDVIVPILIWSFFAILTYYRGSKVFINNLSRWKRQRDGWLVSEQETGELDNSILPADLPSIRNELHQKQRYAVIAAIVIIILISMGGAGYVQIRQNEWTQVVYESPSGGENLVIGDWVCGSFTGVEPSPSVTLGVTCEGRILDWIGGSGYVYFTFEHRPMTWSDYQDLNETEFLDMFETGEIGQHGVVGTFGVGLSGPIHDSEYVWALRFNDINGRTSGSVDIWFQVILGAFLY